MTDPFEDAVRQAARGLSATDTSHDVPTYHSSWQRGRRRRFVKQAGIAGAGVLLFVAAFSADLGSFRGTQSETDDVALSVEAATAVPAGLPDPIATTEPLTVPTPTVNPEPNPSPVQAQPAPAITVVAAPEPAAPAPADAPTADAETVTTDLPATEPTATGQPDAGPTTAGPPADGLQPTDSASEPATSQATDLAVEVDTPPAAVDGRETDPQTASDATGTTQDAELDSATDATGRPSETSTSSDQDGGGTSPTPEPSEPAPTETPAAVPAPAVPPAISADDMMAVPSDTAPIFADATLLTVLGEDGVAGCDTTGDGVTNAVCELTPPYACDGDGRILPGYTVVDTDSDGIRDSCVFVDASSCDTTGDGLGDTSCVIVAMQQPAAVN